MSCGENQGIQNPRVITWSISSLSRNLSIVRLRNSGSSSLDKLGDDLDENLAVSTSISIQSFWNDSKSQYRGQSESREESYSFLSS